MPDTSMDFNSRYYLIESVQQIIKTIGDNCIVEGLTITDVYIDDNRYNLIVNLSKGKVICDSTLIEFPEDMVLPLDITNLDSTGKIILSVNFRYLRTSRHNLASVSLKFLNNSNICTEWFPNKDKIVIAVFEYNKLLRSIITHQSTFLEEKTVSINSINYEIRPYNYTIQQLRPLLKLIADKISL